MIVLGFIFTLFLSSVKASEGLQNSLLYVWDSGFIGSYECTSLFQTKDIAPQCWGNTWGTADQLQRLVDTVKSGNVSTIPLSGPGSRIIDHSNGEYLCKCPETDDVHDTLTKLHEAGAEVYALFAASDENVSERFMVPCVQNYNMVCSKSDQDKFDGVAVNNEQLSNIIANKGCEAQLVDDHLRKLTEVKVNAGGLPFHFSVGFWWNKPDVCGDITFNGKVKPLLQHVVDIADGIDIQVASNKAERMTQAAIEAEAKYAISSGKKAWVLVYTGAMENCYITFYDGKDKCDGDGAKRCEELVDGVKRCSQQGMVHELATATQSLPGLLPGIHAYSIAFQSGATDWERSS